MCTRRKRSKFLTFESLVSRFHYYSILSRYDFFISKTIEDPDPNIDVNMSNALEGLGSPTNYFKEKIYSMIDISGPCSLSHFLIKKIRYYKYYLRGNISHKWGNSCGTAEPAHAQNLDRQWETELEGFSQTRMTI